MMSAILRCPIECLVLKNFNCLESIVTNCEVKHLPRSLVEKNDVSSKFIYKVGRLIQETQVQFIYRPSYGNDLPNTLYSIKILS